MKRKRPIWGDIVRDSEAVVLDVEAMPKRDREGIFWARYQMCKAIVCIHGFMRDARKAHKSLDDRVRELERRDRDRSEAEAGDDL